MLEPKSTGQRGRMTATRSGRNSNEDVAGATTEAFARWFYNRAALEMRECIVTIVWRNFVCVAYMVRHVLYR